MRTITVRVTTILASISASCFLSCVNTSPRHLDVTPLGDVPLTCLVHWENFLGKTNVSHRRFSCIGRWIHSMHAGDFHLINQTTPCHRLQISADRSPRPSIAVPLPQRLRPSTHFIKIMKKRSNSSQCKVYVKWPPLLQRTTGVHRW